MIQDSREARFVLHRCDVAESVKVCSLWINTDAKTSQPLSHADCSWHRLTTTKYSLSADRVEC